MQLGVEHILRGCGRRTSCMQASRHDCRHDTRGRRLLPEHVSHYISPSWETLSEHTNSGDAAAGLTTVTPTALDRGRVFETVPELKKKKNFTSFGQPNKADLLCQLWQSSSNLFVDHVCVWMCQCQKGPQYPLTKSSCQPTVCAYEWRCPIVKWHLIVYCR